VIVEMIVGMIAVIVEMIVGMIAVIAGVIAGTIAGTAGVTEGMIATVGAERKRKDTAMGLIGDRKTLATAGASIRTIPAITGKVTQNIARDSVGDTRRGIVSTRLADGNQRVLKPEAKANKRAAGFNPAALSFAISLSSWQYSHRFPSLRTM
jgi:hypothetical protein